MEIEKIFYIVIVFLLIIIQISLFYLLKSKDLITSKLELFEEQQTQNLKKYYKRIELLEETIQPILNEAEALLNEISKV